MAPEVLKGEKYGLKSDIWSIGVIFFIMIYHNTDYNIRHEEAHKIAYRQKSIFKFKTIENI